MKISHILDLLDIVESDAPDGILDWLETRRDFASAWVECPRGDWLLWLATRLGVDRRLVVKAACACARSMLEACGGEHRRFWEAIETADAFARGVADLKSVRSARIHAEWAASGASRFFDFEPDEVQAARGCVAVIQAAEWSTYEGLGSLSIAVSAIEGADPAIARRILAAAAVEGGAR